MDNNKNNTKANANANDVRPPLKLHSPWRTNEYANFRFTSACAMFKDILEAFVKAMDMLLHDTMVERN